MPQPQITWVTYLCHQHGGEAGNSPPRPPGFPGGKPDKRITPHQLHNLQISNYTNQ